MMITDVLGFDLGMRIAYRSTRGDMAKPRWTELSVWLAGQESTGPRWTALAIGRTTLEGERDRVRHMRGDTLQQVLTFFDKSAPARFVRDEATAWAKQNPDLAALRPIDLPFTGATDMEALAWLYGPEASQTRGIYARMAEDFGIGESTIRQALQRGTGLRLPLTEVARFIDRAAFRRAHELRAAIREEKAAANG